ncbi:phosphogluconate dehydratase [Denitrificimonas sp. JX-1]|uniref:Phosphogluconate dehydratase n=1 Tax=Denitrificimonas halotolerans TaxID=3098930 RepID=A0ABU5GT65_9GAMM|nr:phosphogluconate dehydratase [Denitrificimonas sp. JX-1]MDY7218833.1 phosphogluconate dehydratase [Denitrificimonas sp. JX-1]
MLNPVVERITQALEERSKQRRDAYLSTLMQAAEQGRNTAHGCSNLAHVMAAQSDEQRLIMRQGGAAHIAIISSYNDMLSAHAPLKDYPDQLKAALYRYGASAQFASGVPAMCDGVTQGTAGMQLSLFSRDLIAQATAVGLSHAVFDGALYLGVCDKIVPGLLIGALHFGHLPAVFVPAGPMRSGLSNPEKAAVRERYAAGNATRDELLEAELAAYHEPGTCTFYGTANTNQLLMEALGLHVPGSAFVSPGSKLRHALTDEAARLLIENTTQGGHYLPLGEQINAKALINGAVAILSSGGSTNHTLHLPAIARAAGYELLWEDLAALSKVVPLLAHVYPSGVADVNQFHAAGGVGWLFAQLLDAGLMHSDVYTIAGRGLDRYTREPYLQTGRLCWRNIAISPLEKDILRPVIAPFATHSGLHMVTGNLGRAVIKTSAVQERYWSIKAPARVFDCEADALEAYDKGRLNGDLIMVVRFQGPAANGMPELHKLMPILANLQAKGQKVALVTDGRLSGASGKVLAAIHLTPEAAKGGPLSRVQDGDILEIDAKHDCLQLHLAEQEFAQRPTVQAPRNATAGYGLQLFAAQRRSVGPADQGASFLIED